MKGSKTTSVESSESDNLLDDIDIRVFDSDAMTVREIADSIGEGLPRVRALARKKIEEGKWEQVYKKLGNGVAVAAYRKKK